MKDLTVEDIRKVASGRYIRKHRGKIAIIASSIIAWMILWVIVYSNYMHGARLIDGYVEVKDMWFWIINFFLFSSLIIYVVLAIVFSYLESRFVWKFQQEWADSNKTVPEDYRS
jgi:hypothetical protein